MKDDNDDDDAKSKGQLQQYKNDAHQNNLPWTGFM